MATLSIEDCRIEYPGKSDKEIAIALAKKDPSIFAIVRYKRSRDEPYNNFGICWSAIEIDNYLLNNDLIAETIYDRRKNMRDVEEIQHFLPAWARKPTDLDEIASEEDSSPKDGENVINVTPKKTIDKAKREEIARWVASRNAMELERLRKKRELQAERLRKEKKLEFQKNHVGPVLRQNTIGP